MKVKIFFCYAHEDEVLLEKLKKQLRSLEREGLIDIWYDRNIDAGTEWEQEIRDNLDIAQIILLLVSPDFMASDYCYGVEMKRALERQERGETRVIPIILRPCHWQVPPLRKLQALPTDAKPVTDHFWHTEDAALFNVMNGIRDVVDQLPQAKPFVSSPLTSTSPMAYTNASSPIQQPSSLTMNTSISQQPPSAVIPKEWMFIHTLVGHYNRVTSIAVSADGQTLISGSWDHTVKVWNLHTGELLRTLEGHSDAVMSVAISEDGQTLASGSLDRTIRLWDRRTGMTLHTLEHGGRVVNVAISSDEQIVASGSIDKTIKLWNLNTGRLLHILEGHSDAVLSIAISPNGQTLVSGSLDGTIKLWNLHSGRFLRTSDENSGGVLSLAIDGEGHTLVSGGWDRTIKVWSLGVGGVGGRLLGMFEELSDVITTVALSRDGQFLVNGSWDYTINIWRRQRADAS